MRSVSFRSVAPAPMVPAEPLASSKVGLTCFALNAPSDIRSGGDFVCPPENRARYWNKKPRQGCMPSDPFLEYDYSLVALIAKAVGKGDLPTKDCAVWGRPFS